MACSQDFMQYVIDQLTGVGEIRTRKMFGDWCVYVNDKPVMLCCDNVAYIKKLPIVENLMAEACCGFPFEGAREHYILDLDNRQLTQKAIVLLVSATPLPKRRTKK